MYTLQKALKQKGIIIPITEQQFYSEEQNRFITMYIVKHNKQQIRTASQLKVIEYLKGKLEESRKEIHN